MNTGFSKYLPHAWPWLGLLSCSEETGEISTLCYSNLGEGD